MINFVLNLLLACMGFGTGFYFAEARWTKKERRFNASFELDEKDFGDLVRGRPVALPDSNVVIALSDIGWDRMYFQIEGAMREAGEGDL